MENLSQLKILIVLSLSNFINYQIKINDNFFESSKEEEEEEKKGGEGERGYYKQIH